ncbi:MAG TPA: hypothetical protein ENI96_11060 [Sedimenticola thiotaurini]|uniref:Outer membrane beta-barrel protein n=1 Tax=Sedimenticola thiotaurini TaxID=1543721 RepID=A0A831RQP1_9GAMM|nr:hypothetical protein [Sedimenticola thiotaurini]
MKGALCKGGLLPAAVLAAWSGAALPAEKSGFDFNVEGQVRYDDNVYRTLDRFAESDTLFVLKPELSWTALRGKHRFDLSYQGDYAAYLDVTDLNYDDHLLEGRALLDHSYRLNSEYTLGYRRDHDRPGQTDALSIPVGEVDKWWDAYGDARVTYGRDDSKGQIVGQLNYHQRRYTNNRQEFRDYNLVQAIGTFYYRVAPKTRMLFELDFSDYDYQKRDLFGNNQSNKQYLYLTGVRWEATAKTTGIFKIGYRNRDYDSDLYGDLSGLALWLDGIWKPNTYTRVTFGAAEDNQNSAQRFSNGYVRRYIRGGIDHGITPRTLISAKVQYGTDTFEGPFDRKDNRWYLRLGVSHSLRRWLDVGAEYRFEQRDSSLDIYDFDANVFLVSATTRFD